jgi:hypothetical protein
MRKKCLIQILFTTSYILSKMASSTRPVIGLDSTVGQVDMMFVKCLVHNGHPTNKSSHGC